MLSTLMEAPPNAEKNSPDTPGMLLMLSPTAAMMEQLWITDMSDTIPCFSS